MDFHAEFFPKVFNKKIEHSQKLFLIGSCFTEQIGTKLASHKFDIIQNPNGILFNPISIASALSSYVDEKKYTGEDLFYQNELWSSWQHHSRFSGMEKEQVLENINSSQAIASASLKKSDWLLITLGSAFVYENVTSPADYPYQNVVANCHKIPPDKFHRRLLQLVEVRKVLEEMIKKSALLTPTYILFLRSVLCAT